jgi:hypothetical protein
MPAAYIYSDDILVALHHKSGETYIHSICVRCLVSRHRQRAYKDKGVLFRSLCIFWQSSTIRISRGSARALAGSWQQRHASLHQVRMQLSALAPSPSRPGHADRHLISGLFRRAVSSSGAMCRSRGSPPASSSPLGSYSCPAAHRITPHNLTSPLYFPLSTNIIFSSENPPRQYTQRLDRAIGHDMPRLRHPTLTCTARDTNGRIGRSCRPRVRACAAPTCISRQT